MSSACRSKYNEIKQMGIAWMGAPPAILLPPRVVTRVFHLQDNRSLCVLTSPWKHYIYFDRRSTFFWHKIITTGGCSRMPSSQAWAISASPSSTRCPNAQVRGFLRWVGTVAGTVVCSPYRPCNFFVHRKSCKFEFLEFIIFHFRNVCFTDSPARKKLARRSYVGLPAPEDQ